VAFLDSFKKMFGSKGGDERSDLEKKLKATPNDPQLRQKYALVLLKQREVVEGVSELARAAELYEKDGFAGKAIAVLRQLLKYDIDNVEMQQRLIALLARQGLAGDALSEFEKFNGGLAGKLTEDQRVEFCGKIAESLPRTAVPHLFAVDVLLSQHKLYEAVSSLEKAAAPAVAGGDVPRYAERLKALVSAAGESVEHLEPCGFLWYRVGDSEQGLALFRKIRDAASSADDPDRLSVVDRVLDAISAGWNPATSDALSFTDALAAIAAPPKSEPVAQGAAPPPSGRSQDAPTAPASQAMPGDEAALEAEEDASMVKDALGRLQAKVDEEIGDSDLETRYNLGIAYKEMGLLDEALKEFRIAARKADLRLGATTLLADVMAEQGDLDGALAELDGLIESGILDTSAARDVRYHKAIMLERAGRDDDAGELFLTISAESPGYRDAKARAERLGR
jgi:tetratricopeptide (TPR) repeat protein